MTNAATTQQFEMWTTDNCQPHTLRWVRPDGWAHYAPLSKSNWDGSQFRVASRNYTDQSYAVNVKTTGRTIQRNQGMDVVRVEIEFVGDGEPSTFVRGWMEVGR